MDYPYRYKSKISIFKIFYGIVTIFWVFERFSLVCQPCFRYVYVLQSILIWYMQSTLKRQTHFQYNALQHKHFEREVSLPLDDVGTIFNIYFICTCADMVHRLYPEYRSFLKFMSSKWKRHTFPAVNCQNILVKRLLTGNTLKSLEKHPKHNVSKPDNFRMNMIT